jgi:hypothetical protein
VLAVLPGEGQRLGQALPEVDTRLPTGETLSVVDVDRADVDLLPFRRPRHGLHRSTLVSEFLTEAGDVEQRDGLDAADV